MRNQRGQTLLIVVLVMVVALTVGLSVASRSITNLRTTTEEENSQRAFSAAEAGVELALKSTCPPPCSPTGVFENKAQFATVTSRVEGTEFLVNNGNPVFKDDGADVWLSNYPNYSSPLTPQFFTIYWGSMSDSCPNSSALEVIVISGSRNAPTAKRYAYDPCSRDNNFSKLVSPNVGTFSVKGKQFRYRTPTNDINITNGLIARAVPLYTSTPIAVSTCNPAGEKCTSLPAQGKVIESTGQSGGTARKVTLFQGYPKLPSEFFQYIIFSP